MVEFLIGVVITIVVSAMTAVGLRELVVSSHREGAANALLFAIRLTQSEAIARNARVVLCKSADGLSCTNVGGWEQGWLVFHDVDFNGALGSREYVLMRQQALNSSVRAIGNTNIVNKITYTALGRPTQIGTFTICTKESTNTKASKIVIDIVGRPRMAELQPVKCP